MQILKKVFNKYVLLFTFVIWGIINISGIQKNYFVIDKTVTYAIIKVVHFIFLYFIFYKIYSLIKNRKEKQGKIELITFIVYFCILFVLLIAMWPGTWSWDDIVVLNGTAVLDFTPWQHFFSGVFQTLCLQTIPIASGVIFMQILIAAQILGYVVSKIASIYGNTKKEQIVIVVILTLIGLFPPVILYILSGFRMGMYSFLELLVITKLLVLYKEDKKASIIDILEITFFTIIISCWRTEGIYYPFLIFVLYLCLGKKKISRKVSIIILIVTLGFNLGITKYNNYLIGNNNYSITATMEPVTALVKIADDTDTAEIESINKVIDVDFVLNNPNMNGEDYYWKDGVVKEYSDEEYSNYLKAYLKMTLKYPEVTVSSMWNIFYRAISGQGVDGQQTTRNNLTKHASTIKLYDITNGAGEKWNENRSNLKDPINLNIRNKLILFLGGIDEDGNITIIHRVFWNLFIPIILILISLVYKIIKRDWYMVLLILAVIARIPLVFVTAPAPYFMYYLSTYLCGYVVSFIVIYEFIYNFVARRKKSK